MMENGVALYWELSQGNEPGTVQTRLEDFSLILTLNSEIIEEKVI